MALKYAKRVLTSLVTSITGVNSDPALLFSYTPSGTKLHSLSMLTVGVYVVPLFKWNVLIPT